MKKLFGLLSLSVFLSFSVVSCGGKTTSEEIVNEEVDKKCCKGKDKKCESKSDSTKACCKMDSTKENMKMTCSQMKEDCEKKCASDSSSCDSCSAECKKMCAEMASTDSTKVID